MACTRLKCVSCDLLVSEPLAFIQNKLKVMDEETLIRICNTAFSPEEILEAKKLLFEAVPIKRLKIRKTEDRSIKDLEDIIELLKHTDATDPERIPIFVARELHRLPPVTFDHVDVTRLLRDIALLREDLREMKKEYVTQGQLREMIDLSREKQIDNVNRKRGAFIGRNSCISDSGPMGLTQYYTNDGSLHSVKCNEAEECENMSLSLSPAQVLDTDAQVQAVGLAARGGRTAVSIEERDGEYAISNSQQSRSETTSSVTRGGRTAVSTSKRDGCTESCSQPSRSETTLHALVKEPVVSGAGLSYLTPSATNERERMTVDDARAAGAECTGKKSIECSARASKESPPAASERKRTMADVVRQTETESKQRLPSDDGWIKVQRKKPLLKNRFISETGSAGCDIKFRAAPVNKVPLYISNVCKSTTESDIVEYIRKKTNESVVLEKLSCKREREYNSFKLLVSRNKLGMFMNKAIWPEGICFRRFVMFNNLDGRSSETSKKPSQRLES